MRDQLRDGVHTGTQIGNRQAYRDSKNWTAVVTITGISQFSVACAKQIV